MERVTGLGPAHEAAIAREAKTTRRQPRCVFFDVGGVLASDGLPSQGLSAPTSAEAERDVDGDRGMHTREPAMHAPAGRKQCTLLSLVHVQWNATQTHSPPTHAGGAAVFAAAGLNHVTDELVKEKGAPLWDRVKVRSGVVHFRTWLLWYAACRGGIRARTRRVSTAWPTVASLHQPS